MPNWCFNTLVVTGEKTEVERFKKAVKPTREEETHVVTDLSLEKLYPLPADRDWYVWCTEHWGTKWDCQAKLESDELGKLTYTFESAWAPPLPWLLHVSRLYPKLNFWLDYEEPDAEVFGTVVVRDGHVRKEDQSKH